MWGGFFYTFTPVMGVYHDTSKKGKNSRHDCWRAEIVIKGQRIRIGRFKNKEDADKALQTVKAKGQMILFT